MNLLFILALMIFLHIVDDYHLQGILAKMKQEHWWLNQDDYSQRYRNDWLAALIAHAFSWSFMIQLPYAIVLDFNVGIDYAVMLIINTAVHARVDHMKTNLKTINLIEDQMYHMIQILVTFAVMLQRM